MNEAVKVMINEIMKFDSRKTAGQIYNKLIVDYNLKKAIIPTLGQVKNHVAYQRTLIAKNAVDDIAESKDFKLVFLSFLLWI
jgi:hypothetical protein